MKKIKIKDEKLIATLEKITYDYLARMTRQENFDVEIEVLKIYARVVKDGRTFPVIVELEVDTPH